MHLSPKVFGGGQAFRPARLIPGIGGEKLLRCVALRRVAAGIVPPMERGCTMQDRTTPGDRRLSDSANSQDRGQYIGLSRAADAAAHNARVPADGEADACRCPGCLSPCTAFGSARGPAAVAEAASIAAGPVAALPLLTRGRPALRGPVQDESGVLDPVDAAAMRAVQGGDDVL